jgi:hypothetical protein
MKIAGLVIATLSVLLNLRIQRCSDSSFCGRWMVSVFLGIVCILFSNQMAHWAQLGIHGTQPQQIPAQVFVSLGFILLFISFIPIIWGF